MRSTMKSGCVIFLDLNLLHTSLATTNTGTMMPYHWVRGFLQRWSTVILLMLDDLVVGVVIDIISELTAAMHAIRAMATQITFRIAEMRSHFECDRRCHPKYLLPTETLQLSMNTIHEHNLR